MRSTLALTLGLLIAVPALLQTAQAQRKPDPRPRQVESRAPDLRLWQDGYEAAGEPRLLLIVGLADRHAGQSGESLGSTISLFDPAGDAQALKANMSQLLRSNRDVDLIQPEALADRDRREVAILAQSHERRAIDLMATKLNADFVITVKMIERPGRGVPYRVIVEGVETGRGTQALGFTFDWADAGLDGYSIKTYAGQVTRKIIEQFHHWYAGSRGDATLRYDLRVYGLENPIEDLMRTKQKLESIPGVRRCRDRGITDVGGESMATLRIQFDGSPMELSYSVLKIARDELNMDIDTVDAAAGTITLVTRPKPKAMLEVPPSERPRWMNLTRFDDEYAMRMRSDFLAEYEREGEPTIGVMVNRELTDQDVAAADAELRDEFERLKKEIDASRGADGDTSSPTVEDSAAAAASGGNGTPPVFVYMPVNVASEGTIVTGGGGGGTTTVRPEDDDDDNDGMQAPAADLLNTRMVEDAIAKRLGHLNLKRKDPYSAMNAIRREQNKARRVFREDELPYLLGRDAGIDVMILGLGNVEPGRGLSYTFRAVRVNDGQLLASSFWRRDLRFDRESEVDQAIDEVADYIAGDLADQLWRAWQPPRTLSMTIFDARTQKDVMMVRSALLDNITSIQDVRFERHDGGMEGGLGYLTIRYDSTLEELQNEIIRLSTKLPFDLDASTSTRDTINIRIKDA